MGLLCIMLGLLSVFFGYKIFTDKLKIPDDKVYNVLDENDSIIKVNFQ